MFNYIGIDVSKATLQVYIPIKDENISIENSKKALIYSGWLCHCHTSPSKTSRTNFALKSALYTFLFTLIFLSLFFLF